MGRKFTYTLVPEMVFNIVINCINTDKPVPSGSDYIKCFHAINSGARFAGVSGGMAVLEHK